MKYDVVVVGTRVAGAAIALLLARQGVRVLAVDRAHQGSDTLSTHQIQLPGGARLKQWGLLDRVVATGCPPASSVRFDSGFGVLSGDYPSHGGVGAVYSPRRTLLDVVLQEAAAEAGADVRDGFVVDGLRTGRDGRVTGIRGSSRGSSRGAASRGSSSRGAVGGSSGGGASVGVTEEIEADLVIGADGKHSTVAQAVGAATYLDRGATAAACYTYFAGLPVSGGEVYLRPDRMVGLWPTNDGLTIVFLSVPAARFAAMRSDLDAAYRHLVGEVADLGPRLAAATQAERLRATPDLPNRFRQPYGPGWALVGDAGVVMDPCTGLGIGHALHDAELFGDAVLSGDFAQAHRVRDAYRKPVFDMTTQLAAYRPDRTGAVVFPALAEDPRLVTEFLGVLTGITPPDRFFRPGRLRRIVGWRGLGRLALARHAAPTRA
ncbi:MAG: FAD-dependent monooxygenase [Hamadaea sp.]|uniref:NAD(P)/FAD-dependent oxidoreductase n=1 Tax=Hamadaea sp. TaxID=2024425 RepID=UPI0017B147E5|nr:FAD-dependent monooxygenase [Hamadaea sp.]NUR69463.1 FAD-dependent monooxygenase [Hamadaea sp.]NUT23374.1 FAD-dependent monooxygenase [Hamadaea sp.]